VTRLGHQHFKGNRNVGTWHAEFSKERSQRVKSGGLGEVQRPHSILVAAETQHVLGWFISTFATFDVEDARALGAGPVGVGAHASVSRSWRQSASQAA